VKAPSFTIAKAPASVEETKALLLLLGAPKVGKTEAASSWPSPFMVSWDPNLETFFRHCPGAPYVVPESPTQFEAEILPWIVGGGLAADYPDVESVLFDSISFYAKKLELEIMGTGTQLDAKGGDWQTFGNRVMKTLSQLTRVAKSSGIPKNFNLIATCHEKDKMTASKDGGQWVEKLIGIDPAIAGKQVHPILPGFFDLVLYMTRRNESVQQLDGPKKGQFVRERRYVALAFEPQDHRAPAGGTLWGHTLPPEIEDASYSGLRKLCGLSDKVTPP
jgi:hypothetical protein